jgi:hypothetical protein
MRNKRAYLPFLARRDRNIWSIYEDFAMRKFLSALCATALTASVAVTGALPASAAPVFIPKAATVEHSDVVNVQDFRWKKRGNWNGNWNGNNFRRSNNWNGNKNWKNWNGPKYGYYNGHRGYPYKRYRNDRYYNGFWFPAGAFIAGAIIGGAIANNNNYYNNGYGGGNAHVQWCYDRYRSYRAYDNTFQPYNGPRQQCYSPYS